MTAGSNGVPEDDDPFAYLYRSGGADGAEEQTAGPAGADGRQSGVPRTSYAQATRVGRTQYGQPRPGPGAGYGRPSQPPPAPYGGAPQPPSPRGMNRYAAPGGRGVLIGAVAVVCAIAVGIGVALFSNPDKGVAETAGRTATPSAGAGAGGTNPAGTSPSGSANASAGASPVVDAATLHLSGGSVLAHAVPGARSNGGTYVDGMNRPGASAGWSVTVPAAGRYQLWVRYNDSGADAAATVSVDGKPTATPIKLKNYAPGQQPRSSWFKSWVYADLTAGAHTITVSCQAGNQCGFLLDQMAITPDGASGVPGW